ncbi:hypothetical protein P1J78_02355 [Psychromarinibacter sp. C21-152]|uniref:Uncharacterized protein n=1 Tax=Psychromarinibacter sediminicola TaxID=3033385 RepID=A0AAE3NLM0_9RHOB|nr:hypothetical protein [Psychromarinibacter sediminicola]MDF0599563.1 hypothetical protein [Psychromarinibacter sediminicola]
MDALAPIPQLGAGVIPIRAQADAGAVALTPVEASAGGRGPQARMDTAPQSTGRIPVRDRRDGDGDSGPAYRDRPKIDDNTLLGPSPAFQANILELERDLRRAIERLEGERSRAEAEAAIKVEKAEAALERAEMARQSAEAAVSADLPDAPEAPEKTTPTTPETANASPAPTGDAEVPEDTGTEVAEPAA